MSRVLIAGCGYVGLKLAEDLAADGAEVFCLRRRVHEDADHPEVHWLSGDMARDQLSFLPQKLDALVFAAAPGGASIEAYESVYVRALGRVLDHVRAGASPGFRAVLTSSTSVYGQTGGEWVDEDTPAEAAGFSGQMVRAGEALLRPGDVAVRLGGIYGPGRTSMIEAVRAGTAAIPLVSAYTNRIHRDDAAGILRHVLRIGDPAAVYNGVDSEPAARGDVLAWIAARLGVQLATRTTEEPSLLRGNKRVRNDRLLKSGYRLLYPSFRDGYGALLEGKA